MIKGNERRVVVLKGDKSSECDVAYVFMKDGKASKKKKHSLGSFS